jgi:hypothetical protein
MKRSSPIPRPKGSGEYQARLSITMYCLFKSLERKTKYWVKLINEAGLAIKEILKFTGFGDAVIVAGKKLGQKRERMSK